MRYEYACECGTRFERYLPVARYAEPQTCECGRVAVKQLSVPIIFKAQDVCYDSPIDGRPITSMAARRDDMARNNCREYDPGMRQDYERRQRESEAALDRAVDETVDRAIAQMPSAKREKLEAEMQAGVTAEPVRLAAPYKPIKVDINGA